ncbi:hypothetical protein J5226_20235 [Lysobacter sp. K5869]|uniref:hypothetical protein n=1 Tax=Lysobacter sp. K5869 TaxID=2820808 RepID=UPI001C0644EC|nr:hypothetical protein [Lysobacter sp. K5869]QWP75910.1 hypothetical protein J5226_20235 [Lysobacter sp. K5869]
MTATTQVPAGGDAAAESVAAHFDRIAAQSSVQSSPAPAQPPVAPPPGPSLQPDEWIARIFQLIDSLRSPSDLEPTHVAKTIGLNLHPVGSEQAARGDLGAQGAYALWINTLYRERPGKWTAGLSQEPRAGQKGCLFPLDRLRRHLSGRGYSATEGVRQRDGGERAVYRAAPTADGIVFVISAQWAPGGAGCVQEIRINANTPEDEA